MSGKISHHHPLSNQVRRIHTTHTLLHGRNVRILDWYRNVDLKNDGMTALKQQFVHRCAQVAEHPVTQEMEWFFESRCILALLDCQSDQFILLDVDEILDLRERMQDGLGASVACARHRAKAVRKKLEAMVSYGVSEPRLKALLQPLLTTAAEIEKLVGDEDLIFTDEGLQKLRIARERAHYLHNEIGLVCRLARELWKDSIEDYHQRAVVMKHCEYHSRVGGTPPDSDGTCTKMTLDQLEHFHHGHSSDPLSGVTQALVDDLEEFYILANARYAALLAWQNGQPTTASITPAWAELRPTAMEVAPS